MAIDRKYIEALKDDANKIGLAALFAGCAVSGTLPLFPFIAVPAQAAYLLFVPDSPWFQKRLARKAAAEAEARRQALRDTILPTLRPADQRRYEVLEQTRAEIAQQPVPSMGAWYAEVLAKLDFLLDQYLQFGARAMQYRRYLVSLGQRQAQLFGQLLKLPGFGRDSGDPADQLEFARNVPAEALIHAVVEFFDRQADRLARDMEREKDRELLDVMRKNAEVIRSNKTSVEQIGRLLRSIEHQLDLVANTFTLINTQIRTGSPERILADVEDVVTQSNALTQTMEEFDTLDESLERLGRVTAPRG